MKQKTNNYEIDGIDKIILKTLMNDARIPIQILSKKTGISGAAVHQRLKKLEKSGIISGSQINVDPKSLGYKTLAFIGVFLDKAIRNNEAVKKIEEVPEIIECHYTTGNWSVFIKVLCHDNEHLMELIKNKLQTINGISRTETFISLQQQVVRQIEV